jgi:hypothetical protein
LVAGVGAGGEGGAVTAIGEQQGQRSGGVLVAGVIQPPGSWITSSMAASDSGRIKPCGAGPDRGLLVRFEEAGPGGVVELAMGRRLALLIATYDYEDTGLRRLTAPASDAEELAAVLRNPDIAGFDVKTMINEPHYRVGEAIAELYREHRRDDITLLYFTGHGLKDDDGRLYLAMANTHRDSLLFTAIAAE